MALQSNSLSGWSGTDGAAWRKTFSTLEQHEFVIWRRYVRPHVSMIQALDENGSYDYKKLYICIKHATPWSVLPLVVHYPRKYPRHGVCMAAILLYRTYYMNILTLVVMDGMPIAPATLEICFQLIDVWTWLIILNITSVVCATHYKAIC
jgi:hypothetical protein